MPSIQPTGIRAAPAWLLLFLAMPCLAAAVADGLEISVDSGGGEATGNGYALQSTFGQPDHQTLRGGSNTLELGFQRSDTPPDGILFSDGFESTGVSP